MSVHFIRVKGCDDNIAWINADQIECFYYSPKLNSTDIHMIGNPNENWTIDGDATGYITARKQGTWVKMTGSMPPKYQGHYECSECGWHGEAYERRETDYDFCPHCGAIMSK